MDVFRVNFRLQETDDVINQLLYHSDHGNLARIVIRAYMRNESIAIFPLPSFKDLPMKKKCYLRFYHDIDADIFDWMWSIDAEKIGPTIRQLIRNAIRKADEFVAIPLDQLNPVENRQTRQSNTQINSQPNEKSKISQVETKVKKRDPISLLLS